MQPPWSLRRDSPVRAIVESIFRNNISSTFFKQAPPGSNPTTDFVTVGDIIANQPVLTRCLLYFKTIPTASLTGLATFPLSLTHNAYQRVFPGRLQCE
jgi:hypothetical protein